jgi:predicted nucleic acid-binding protein
MWSRIDRCYRVGSFMFSGRYRYVSIERRRRILDIILMSAQTIEPTEIVRECTDPKDDKYLTLAAAGKADVIVSSDVHHLLSMHPWRGISILSPANFLALA